MSDPFSNPLHFSNGTNFAGNGAPIAPHSGQIGNAPATRSAQPVLALRESTSAADIRLASTRKRAASDSDLGPEHVKRARRESEEGPVDVPDLQKSAEDDGSLAMEARETWLAAPAMATDTGTTTTTLTATTTTTTTTLASTMPSYAGSASSGTMTNAVAVWPMPSTEHMQGASEAESMGMVDSDCAN